VSGGFMLLWGFFIGDLFISKGSNTYTAETVVCGKRKVKGNVVGFYS